VGSSFVKILLVILVGLAPVPQDASSTDPRITELNAAMQKGQFLDVLKKGRAILIKQPTHPHFLLITGAACIELARTLKDSEAKIQAYAEAENLFRRFVIVNPRHNNSKVEQSLARCCLTREDWKNAKKHAAKAIQLSPSSTMAHRVMGESLSGLKIHKEAIQSYKKALAITPRDVRLMQLVQDEYHSLRRYAEALSFLLKQQDNLPANNRETATFYQLLYRAYVSLNDVENAQVAISKAVSLNPKKPTLASEMALNLYRLGRSEDSRLWAKKALTYQTLNNDSKAICLRILGQLLSHEGKYQEGLLALEKSFQINPDDRSTVIAMIAALRRTGQEERAQEFLKKMNEMPTDPRE